MTRTFFYFFILAVALTCLYVVVSALYKAGRAGLAAFVRYRGQRVVVCPETKNYAAVVVDARHAATTASQGETELVLRSCTRWPERAGCDQACVWQIERAPENCLVRAMLDEWYAGKSCHFCGVGFGEIGWADHKPALLSPDHLIVEWTEIAPERVPDVLQTHRPVCWDCAIAETFRADHPDLVTDRGRRVAARG